MRKDQTYKSQVSQPQRTARSSHRPRSLDPQHTLELGADVGQFLVDSLIISASLLLPGRETAGQVRRVPES